jgi:SAM-dependent methyltransferase
MADDYVHGFSPEEQARLTRMQDLLNDAQRAVMDLAGVTRLLDVGCGLGQLTRAFARDLPPDATVVGVERNDLQRDEAIRQAEAAGEAGRVEFRAGDAAALPLSDGERGTFDLCHARFLLEHVRDPEAVVRQMVAAVRPGGRVVLVDDDHDLLRLSPSCPPVEHAWRVYQEGYRDRGQDPWIGRRLPSLLAAAGAPPVRVATVFYGAVHGMPQFDLTVDNLIEVVRGAGDALVEAGRIERADLADALDAFDRWRGRPAATVWYVLPLAEGRRTAD